ncbi:F/Y rich C-terminus-domain-containing protein [Cunninghamella echinulata]|nr:F/Y rich C-terminus-domain-containing protein [Cunninghamella echinulata]
MSSTISSSPVLTSPQPTQTSSSLLTNNNDSTMTENLTTIASEANTPQQQPTFNEEKYKKLKRKLREIMSVNDNMLKEYTDTKKKIKSLTYERNILLDNIARLEHMVSSDDNSSELPTDGSDSGEDSDALVSPPKITKQTKRRQRVKKDKLNSTDSPRELATVASAPPKRSKLSKVPTKTRRVQPIERDETGNPKLPQQIGVLTVLKLGTIVSDREAFHNERYIFPVGYTVSRTYPSMIDPNSNTVITSTILDGGDGPRFHVVADDMKDEPIIANSATGAWTVVVRRSNQIRNRDHSNSASGPDYYGFKHPTIAKMIQDLPGARNLQHYVWQGFEEMEPRAAKGVMAAAEKKRGNLEQMGSANRKGISKGKGKGKSDSPTSTSPTPTTTASTSATNTHHHHDDMIETEEGSTSSAHLITDANISPSASSMIIDDKSNLTHDGNSTIDAGEEDDDDDEDDEIDMEEEEVDEIWSSD